MIEPNLFSIYLILSLLGLYGSFYGLGYTFGRRFGFLEQLVLNNYNTSSYPKLTKEQIDLFLATFFKTNSVELLLPYILN